ncbi:MAG: hypothetical protein HFJ45_08590 [Clostridia bacterium]|nr:hypothetical protein [Clostridia bacterium]
MIRNKRILAMVLTVVMMFCFTAVAFAAEEDGRNVEANDEVHVIELNMEDFEELEEETPYQVGSSGITPRSRTYLLDEEGVASGSISLPFEVIATCTDVYAVVCCKYVDGSTGAVKGSFGSYSGMILVDGKARNAASGITLFPGKYEFKVTGIASTMVYSFQIYIP